MAGQRKAHPNTSRSPVDIQLPVVWQVIVDDKRDLLYVDTTCPDIGGDQHTTTQTYHNPQRSQKGAVKTVHTHIQVTAHTTHTDQPNVCILHHSLQASRTLHRTSAELHRKQMVPVTQASVKTATRFGQNTNALCRNTQQRRSTHCVTPPQYNTGATLLRLSLPCGVSVL